MSTRSVVAYEDVNGEVRGTYVHNFGGLSGAFISLRQRLADEGYEGLITWIEHGINGEGYVSVDHYEPNDYSEDVEDNREIDSQEYGYMISPGHVRLVASKHHTEDEIKYVNGEFFKPIDDGEQIFKDDENTIRRVELEIRVARLERQVRELLGHRDGGV